METKPMQTDQKQTLSLYEPEQMVQFASHLQTFFAENNLIAEVQGKPHVRTPGWQYAGTKLGLIPMVETVEDQSTEKRIQYQTRVALLNLKTETYVGCGVGLCSNLEAGKKNKPAYAIQSLSQTRAIGKAYRNLLGWVVELAGFEPEIPEEDNRPTMSEDALKKALESIEESKASNAKRIELLLALNHECIEREERDQMFSNIFSMNKDRCEKALAKVQKKVNEYDTSNH